MLRHGCLLVLLTLAILVMIPVVAARYVPGWAVLLIIAMEIVGMRYLIPQLVKSGIGRFAMSMIAAKSRVLRGAGVHVHRVELTSAPEDSGECRMIGHEQPIESSAGEATLIGAIPADERYVLVDFTLTPRLAASEGRMNYYDPSELMLVPFEAEVSEKRAKHSAEDDSDAAHAQSVRQFDKNEGEREVDKLSGPARLQVIFSVPPTLSGRVKFRYYFETFGDFLLPM